MSRRLPLIGSSGDKTSKTKAKPAAAQRPPQARTHKRTEAPQPPTLVALVAVSGQSGVRCHSAGPRVLPDCLHCVRSQTSASPGVSPSPSLSCRCTSLRDVEPRELKACCSSSNKCTSDTGLVLKTVGFKLKASNTKIYREKQHKVESKVHSML